MSSDVLKKIMQESLKKNIPSFRTGDTVKVYSKIVEGTKERIQAFQGTVIKRHSGNGPSASFTVRKVSFNIGVERTFMLHSPRIEKIEVVNKGEVRRARLYYLRPLRGKAARIKTQYGVSSVVADEAAPAETKDANEGVAEAASSPA